MNVEIETTIRNGLAVIATGTYTPGASPLPDARRSDGGALPRVG